MMTQKILKNKQFNGFNIDFEIKSESVMVNATAMANIYKEKPYWFLRLDSTQKFIKVLDQEYGDNNQDSQVAESQLENEYNQDSQVPELGLENEYIPSGNILKVIHGGKNSGTWMHELLAMDFAAWLNPNFKLWVYKTILDLRKTYFNANQSVIQEDISSDLKQRIIDLVNEVEILKYNLLKTSESEILITKQKELASLRAKLSFIDQKQLPKTSFEILDREVFSIQNYIYPSSKTDENSVFMTTTQMSEYIEQNYSLQIDPLKLGRELSILDFEASKGTKYFSELKESRHGYYVRLKK